MAKRISITVYVNEIAVHYSGTIEGIVQNIVDEYRRSEVCFGEFMASINFVNTSMEDTLDIISKCRLEIDGWRMCYLTDEEMVMI